MTLCLHNQHVGKSLSATPLSGARVVASRQSCAVRNVKKNRRIKKRGYLVGVEHLPAHLCAHVDELLDPLLRVRVADQAHEVLFSEGDDL